MRGTKPSGGLYWCTGFWLRSRPSYSPSQSASPSPLASGAGQCVTTTLVFGTYVPLVTGTVLAPPFGGCNDATNRRYPTGSIHVDKLMCTERFKLVEIHHEFVCVGVFVSDAAQPSHVVLLLSLEEKEMHRVNVGSKR